MAFRPKGARILVEDIIETLSLEERGARAGITVIVENSNRPRNTTGRIVALGSDPLIEEEGYKEGQIVFFAALAGNRITIEDKEFRSLELQEIIGVKD